MNRRSWTIANLAFLALSLAQGCVVTNTVGDLFLARRIPEQEGIIRPAKQGLGPGEEFVIVSEGGREHRSIDRLPGFGDLLAGDRRVLRSSAPEERSPGPWTTSLAQAPEPVTFRIQVRRDLEWTTEIQVPGLREEPGFFRRLTGWILTPIALVLDIPVLVIGGGGSELYGLLKPFWRRSPVCKCPPGRH